MKNRRNIIIAFLLCATLIVSVGYATLQDILDANGTFEWFAGSHEFDGDIMFTDAVAYNEHAGSSSDSALIMDTDPDKAVFSVKSLSTANTTAFFRFEITNFNPETGHVYLRSITKDCLATLKADSGVTGTVDQNSFLTLEYKVSEDPKDYTNEDDQSFFTADDWKKIDGTAGDHSHEIGTDEKLYLYIAVTLQNGKNNESAAVEISKLESLTATFKIEFGVDNAPVGTPHP